MSSKIAKAIRNEKSEHSIHDLKRSPPLTEDQAAEFVALAFGEPLELDFMIRISLVVGAGKLSRQKYDDKLTHWVSSHLQEHGYVEDPAAFLSMNCAGTFKVHHDTDKNEKVIHVFPRLREITSGVQNPDANTETEDDYNEKLTPQWLCLVSSIVIFKQMLTVKTPSWIERKRCFSYIQETIALFHAAETKLAQREQLDDYEEKVINELDISLLEEKLGVVSEMMKALVDEGKLTSAEQSLLLSQIDSKLKVRREKAEELGDTDLNSKAMKNMKDQISQLEERRENISKIKPIIHGLGDAKELRNIWRRLKSLQKISEKAGTKGRWSSKLTSSEVEALGEVDGLEQRRDDLLRSAQHWFESDEEFDIRTAFFQKEAEKQVYHNKAASKSKDPPQRKEATMVSDGWTTVGKKKGNSSNYYAALT